MTDITDETHPLYNIATDSLDYGCEWLVGIVGPPDENDMARIYHGVGYPSKPSEDDLIALVEELAEDEELGCVGLVYGEDYSFLMKPTIDFVEEYGP